MLECAPISLDSELNLNLGHSPSSSASTRRPISACKPPPSRVTASAAHSGMEEGRIKNPARWRAFWESCQLCASSLNPAGKSKQNWRWVHVVLNSFFRSQFTKPDCKFERCSLRDRPTWAVNGTTRA
jgi:hypothetical protein